VRLEGFGQLKNSMTSSGTKPATFRLRGRKENGYVYSKWRWIEKETIIILFVKNTLEGMPYLEWVTLWKESSVCSVRSPI
jgi:hypothetical protein